MIGNVGTMEVLCALVVFLVGIWYYLVANYNYWKQLGVAGPEPSIIFGNFKDIMLSTLSVAEAVDKMCDKFPGAPMVGVYARRSPLLLLRDPELIKDVFIKDFSNFSERGLSVNEKLDPLNLHLFTLETKRWRSLRPKLSPLFTSGKMKNMFTLILECADYFEAYLDTLVEKGEPIDCREITAKFTTDVIGSCAFGIQMNSLSDEDGQFRKMGRELFKFDLRMKILSTIRSAAPWLYDLIGIPATPKEVTTFFMSSIKQTMEYRKKNNVRRPDLVDTLMELKNNEEQFDFELTDSLLTAQAFVFFVAGFETSSATMSHALYELSQKQDIQERLRKEILESFKKHDGCISYDSVKEMKYLDMVFKETLRLRPAVVVHIRKAVNDYTFRDKNLTIKKGQALWIPVWNIHHDPKNYPNPEVFDPERFTEEMCKSRHPMTYLPFGDGPRNCVGARFAIYQTKLGLIKILSNYKVEVCEKTCIPYKPRPTGILLDATGGIHLKFSKIESKQ